MRKNHGHVRQTCVTEARPQGCMESYGCTLCNLFCCTICEGAEGTLPSECPGVVIGHQDKDLIYKATLDFREGRWLNRPRKTWEEDSIAYDAYSPAVDRAVERLNQDLINHGSRLFCQGCGEIQENCHEGGLNHQPHDFIPGGVPKPLAQEG